MSNTEKLEMIEMVLKSNLMESAKILNIQSCLLGWFSWEQVKENILNFSEVQA